MRNTHPHTSHAYTHIHARTHTHTHTRTHTHTHTHTHTTNTLKFIHNAPMCHQHTHSCMCVHVHVHCIYTPALYPIRPTDLSDLKQLHPSVGTNLESLLTYEGDDFDDTFALTFEVYTCILYMYMYIVYRLMFYISQ